MRSVLFSSLVLFAVLAPGAPAEDSCGPRGDDPRVLVVALDGVPLRLIEQAREVGSFATWHDPIPLVSTFPSLTNISFTAMFQPFGVEPAKGYEVQHYDKKKDDVIGGSPFGYEDRLMAWRDVFDVTGRTIGKKLTNYTRPKKNAWKEVEAFEAYVMESEQDLVMAHVGGTDALLHLRGDDRVLGFLIDLELRLRGLQAQHREQLGRPLHIVILSDHGNTHDKVRMARGIRKRLKKVGLKPSNHLRKPNHVVAPTFGLVNYGALFLYPDKAEAAATVTVAYEGVEIAGWQSGDNEVSVVSAQGKARISWKDVNGRRRFAYVEDTADPLGHAAIRQQLEEEGAVDDEGFADESDWLEASILSYYPDALRRMVDGLTNEYVLNRGTVLFSVAPGYAWGWKSAHVSSWLAGGRLEATHGGLDRDSSLGFYITDDPEFSAPTAMQADRALARYQRLWACDQAGREDARLAEHQSDAATTPAN